jgi:hypothetical protein
MLRDLGNTGSLANVPLRVRSPKHIRVLHNRKKNAVFWAVIGCVALVRTDVSEEHMASIIRVTRIGELQRTLAVTSNGSMLRRSTILYPMHNCTAELHNG